MNFRRIFTRRRKPTPVTCAEAGRTGYLARREKEAARFRATAIALANQIGGLIWRSR
jgi:hypothetical protein